MADPKIDQNFANHTRFDPWYHFFAAPVFAVTAIVGLGDAARYRDFRHILIGLFAIAALLALFHIRIYALKVQDRVIRLEERLRIAMLSPEDIRTRIPDLASSQLVALRFASDQELPALTKKALNEKLSAKQIKQAIQVWRADLHRV